MNWKHNVCVNTEQLRQIEEIDKCRDDVKSQMRDCDDYTRLNVIVEQAKAAVVMCDKCKLKLMGGK